MRDVRRLWLGKGTAPAVVTSRHLGCCECQRSAQGKRNAALRCIVGRSTWLRGSGHMRSYVCRTLSISHLPVCLSDSVCLSLPSTCMSEVVPRPPLTHWSLWKPMATNPTERTPTIRRNSIQLRLHCGAVDFAGAEGKSCSPLEPRLAPGPSLRLISWGWVSFTARDSEERTLFRGGAC